MWLLNTYISPQLLHLPKTTLLKLVIMLKETHIVSSTSLQFYIHLNNTKRYTALEDVHHSPLTDQYPRLQILTKAHFY